MSKPYTDKEIEALPPGTLFASEAGSKRLFLKGEENKYYACTLGQANWHLAWFGIEKVRNKFYLSPIPAEWEIDKTLRYLRSSSSEVPLDLVLLVENPSTSPSKRVLQMKFI